MLLAGPLHAEEDCSKALVPSQEFQYLSNADKIRTVLDTQQSKGNIKNDTAAGKYGDISGNLGLSENQQESVQATYSLGEDWFYGGIFARNAISVAGYNAYSECVLKNGVGVTLVVERIRPNSAVLRQMFRTADGPRVTRTFHLKVLSNNANMEGNQKNIVFKSDDTMFDHKIFVSRTGPGVITVESGYNNSPNNDIVEISPVPSLYRKVERIQRILGDRKNFNAAGKKADVAVCIVRGDTSVQIALSDVIPDIVDKHQTTRSPYAFQGTWDIGKPFDTGTQICAHVGCTVVVGNCAGTAIISGVEQKLDRLEKVEPDQVPDIKQIAAGTLPPFGGRLR
ncbi:MAG: hypothetical protein WBQ75_15230 [Acetobacteraceae bacterium]